MPYLIVSQTVPIIVLAPLIIGLMAYGSRDLVSKTWIAAILLGVFLADDRGEQRLLRGVLPLADARAVTIRWMLATPWGTAEARRSNHSRDFGPGISVCRWMTPDMMGLDGVSRES